MAPCALEQVSESLSSTQNGVVTAEEALTRAVAASVGSFTVGFSAGVATQVHYAKYLPKTARSLLLVPILFGTGAASTMYRRLTNQWEREWMGANAFIPIAEFE